MSKGRILVVDDSPFSRSVLIDMLKENDFEVVGEAGSLDEVIREVKDKKPDLATMDMAMPGTDGFECTRAIHQIDKNIKVIMVSSMMDDEIVKEAKDNNILEFVQKPVEEDELILAINRMLSTEMSYNELESTYADVFKEAISNNIVRLTKEIPSFNNIDNNNNTIMSKGIAIVMGIIGRFSGRMIIDVSYEVAEAMAKTFLKRDSKNINETLNVVSEFTNIVCGNGCSLLNRKNKVFGLRVAPPTIFHGESLNISKSSFKTTAITVKTSFGDIYIDIGFDKRGDHNWTQNI